MGPPRSGMFLYFAGATTDSSPLSASTYHQIGVAVRYPILLHRMSLVGGAYSRKKQDALSH
jgi:hypothetical protein